MDDDQDSSAKTKSESIFDILKEIKKEKGSDECGNDELKKEKVQELIHNCVPGNDQNKTCSNASAPKDDMQSEIKQEHEASENQNSSMVLSIKSEPKYDRENCISSCGIRQNSDRLADERYILRDESVSSDNGEELALQEAKAGVENLILSVKICTEQKNVLHWEAEVEHHQKERVKLMIKISNQLLDEDIIDGLDQILPPGLGTSHGVFTMSFLPGGVVFEPYQESAADNIQCSSSRWDVSKLNWMRFVRCAKDLHQKNVETFHYQGKIYYRTTQDVLPATELLLSDSQYSLNNDQAMDLRLGSVSKISADLENSTDRCRPNLCLAPKMSGEKSFVIGSPGGHTRISDYVCNVCGTQYLSLDGLTEHMLTHIGGKQYVCTLCGRHFAHAYSLKSHVRVHTGEQPFVCKRCGKAFAQSSTLARHMKTHSKPYECALCGKEFFQAIQLQRHIHLHNGEMPYQCTVCGKGYPTSSNYDYHMRTHTGYRPHRCNECGKRFIQPCQLKRHMLLHTGEKPFKCPVCPLRFTQSGHLASHIRTHTGEKPHKCGTCGKLYKDNSSLKRHEQLHSGELPYRCAICDKRFCRLCDLTKHKIVHSTEKPYKCTVCDKAFRRSDRLVSHIRVHTGERPYECKTCGRRFAMNADLRKHIMIHTGEKPLQCTQCEKRFRSHGDLKRHIRTHTGEKPYCCDICMRGFCTLGNMKKHRKTHLNEKKKHHQ